MEDRVKFKRVRNSTGEHYGVRWHCPGCDEAHVLPTRPHERGWDFSETADGRFTLSPSVLVHEVKKPDGTVFSPRCHSFVRNGRMEFCSDSTHALAGKTVEIPDVEEPEP